MFRAPRQMRIKDIIAHLFDFHVMKKKNWTLDQLAAWVERWEPKEIAVSIVNTLPRRMAILGEPNIDQRQAEQEWQQVQQAFEARHKTRRSSPPLP
jgi:hypothetical protein